MLNWTSILIPFFIGILRYKYFGKGLRTLFYFVCYGTLQEVTVRILIESGVENTLPASHLYMLVSTLILGLFFAEILHGTISKKIIYGIVGVFELFCIGDILFFESLDRYPALGQAVGTIMILCFVLTYFYKVMVEAEIKNLAKEPLIWINVGMLFYFAGNLFANLLFNIILEYSREFSKITIYYFSGLNALFYITIAIGFWKTKAKFMKKNVKQANY